MTISQTRTKWRNGKKWTGSNSSRHLSILGGVSNAGHKPLSRTITIHAINFNLNSVTRIMRAARISTSIMFEISQLSILPRSSCRAHARYIFPFSHLSVRVLQLVGIYRNYPISHRFSKQFGMNFSLTEIRWQLIV